MTDGSLASAIVTGVLSAGGGGTLSLAIKGLLDRRKDGADAAAVIMQAGIAQVVSQAAQLDRQGARIAELEHTLNQLVQRSRDHSAWDYKVAARLQEAGIRVDPPPPLGLD